MRVPGRGTLSASASELRGARPSSESSSSSQGRGNPLQRSLVPIRRGRGRGVRAEIEERDTGRERDWQGGKCQFLGKHTATFWEGLDCREIRKAR